MQRWAIIENGVVINVTQGEQLDQAWIECGDEVGIGWTYDGTFHAPPAPPAPPPPSPPVYEWFIDLGPFYDRFGAAKMAVLTSPDAGIKAILADVNIRKWVDLQRADVAQALAYIGSVIPAVDATLQASILTAPVAEHENLALRRLYFS